MRIALGVEYDGTDFQGWQTQQSSVRTVQSCVEAAISQVADHPVQVICAGRTDSGVHAGGQVIHFDTPAQRPLRAWTLGCNAHLPVDVSVRWASVVADHFHARFSAYARRYRYVILNRSLRSALQHRQTTLYYLHTLEAASMHEAGQLLLGENDFSAFRAAGCQSKTPWRNVTELSVVRDGEHVIIEVEANAFLHHMVRNIVGVLIAIGSGERPIAWAGEVLANRDRTQAGITAAPQGLCLLQVKYPAEFELPSYCH